MSQPSISLKYTIASGGIEMYGPGSPSTATPLMNKVSRWMSYGEGDQKEIFQYISKGFSGISIPLAKLADSPESLRPISDQSGRRRGGIYTDGELNLSYAVFDIPEEKKELFKSYSYASLISINIQNTKSPLKIVKNIYFYSEDINGIPPEIMDDFALQVVQEILSSSTEERSSIVPDYIQKKAHEAVKKAIEKFKEYVEEKVKEAFNNLELKYGFIQGAEFLFPIAEAAVGFLVSVLFEVIDNIIEYLFLYNDYTQYTYYLNLSRYQLTSNLVYSNCLDISALPSTWKDKSGIALSKKPINIAPRAHNFSFTPTSDSPDWEKLELQKVMTCGHSIVIFQAASYPIARLSYLLKFEPINSKDFIDFVSFARYFDLPSDVKETPTLIDTEFNITGNFQSYAEARGKEAASELDIDRHAPGALDFRVQMQNSSLHRQEHREFFQGNLFLSDEFF